MKNKIIAIVSILILALIFIFSGKIDSNDRNIIRYEQHIEAKKTEDKGSIQENNLVSHLPLIEITTYGQKIPGNPIRNEKEEVISYELTDDGKEEIKVDIKIFDNEEAQNTISDNAKIESNAFFRIRGNSSRSFDKKSYKIEFIDENEASTKYEVMGMSKADEWALYGPFLDKTLIRNYMWLNISAKIMGYAPNVRFCECYLDGEYNGLYLMMETIEKGSQRVNIASYNENNRIVPYMVKMDKFHDDEIDSLVTFSYYTSHLDYKAGFTILYPSKKYLNEEVKNYISKDISDFEKALYSYDFKNPIKGYEKYIDVDTWVDYYIIQEFLANNDMCSRSTYLYKDKGGKLCMGPVWDFNNVCDNYLAKQYYTEGFYFTTNRIWYEMLFKDEKFVRKVQKRYKELRKTLLSEQYIIDYIDKTIDYLGEAINRNYEIWGYSFERENQAARFEYLKPVERNPQSYEEAVKSYKDFIIERGKWIDNNIESLKQYSHMSINKLYIE